jgi:hypothetical protein
MRNIHGIYRAFQERSYFPAKNPQIILKKDDPPVQPFSFWGWRCQPPPSGQHQEKNGYFEGQHKFGH